MLTKEALLEIVADRINHILDSDNRHYTQYQSAIVRGLLWAYVEEDPGPLDTTTRVEEVIGESFQEKDERFYYKIPPEEKP